MEEKGREMCETRSRRMEKLATIDARSLHCYTRDNVAIKKVVEYWRSMTSIDTDIVSSPSHRSLRKRRGGKQYCFQNSFQQHAKSNLTYRRTGNLTLHPCTTSPPSALPSIATHADRTTHPHSTSPSTRIPITTSLQHLTCHTSFNWHHCDHQTSHPSSQIPIKTCKFPSGIWDRFSVRRRKLQRSARQASLAAPPPMIRMQCIRRARIRFREKKY